MILTIGGYICILLTSVLLFKYNFKLYKLFTLPLFMILLTYFRFFGYYKNIDLPINIDIYLGLSLTIFLTSYLLCSRLKIKQLSHFYVKLGSVNIGLNNKSIVQERTLLIYLTIVIIYCIFDLWLNTKLYGSLENALIRFYGKPIIEGIPPIFKTIQIFTFKALVSFVFVFRFFLDYHKKHSGILFLCIVLLVLISLPRGSRGASTLPFVMIVVADFFAATYLKGFKLSYKIKEYVVMSAVAVIIILSLTVIRDVNYRDAKELISTLSELRMNEAHEQYSEGEGDLLLRDASFCFERYGRDQDYLGLFYTFETLVSAPIPRSLYPNKKVSFGYVLNESKQGGSSLNPQKLNYPNAISWAAGVAGEGWANFGIVGLIFYSILMGCYSGICAKMYFTLLKKITPLSILLGLLFFQMTSSYIRGDILGGFVLGFYPLVIITIVILFLQWIRQIRTKLILNLN